MTAYDRLATRFARIATIGEASSVLGWDAATMMPPGGGVARGDQLAVLAGISHSMLIAPVTGDDLAAAEAATESSGEPDAWSAANLRLMRHAYKRATAMPPDLVEARARANSGCEKVWREARQRSDFAMVRPHLEAVLRLTREAAAASRASRTTSSRCGRTIAKSDCRRASRHTFSQAELARACASTRSGGIAVARV